MSIVTTKKIITYFFHAMEFKRYYSDAFDFVTAKTFTTFYLNVLPHLIYALWL